MQQKYIFPFVYLFLNVCNHFPAVRSITPQAVIGSRLSCKRKFEVPITGSGICHGSWVMESSGSFSPWFLPGALLSLPSLKKLNRFADKPFQPYFKGYPTLYRMPGIILSSSVSSIYGASQNRIMNSNKYTCIFLWAMPGKWWKADWTYFWIFLCLCLAFAASVMLYVDYRNRTHQIWVMQERIKNLKEALLAVQHTKNRFEQKLWLQTRLLASISHDVRTPLGFVSANVKEIKSLLDTGQDEKVVEIMALIALTTDEIINLVHNITSFIENSMHEDQIPFLSINVRELLLQKKKVFQQTINAREAVLSIEVEPILSVKTNPVLLSILIHNLIDNALKVKRGNQVRIFTETISGKLHLFVSDNGPGMPARLLEWLSCDYQSSKYTPSKAGEPAAGLGLVLVKEISQLLGIEVRAKNDSGASVCLIFNS